MVVIEQVYDKVRLDNDTPSRVVRRGRDRARPDPAR